MFSSKTKIVALFAFVALLLSAGVFSGLIYLLTAKEKAFYEQVRERAESKETDTKLAALVNLVADTEDERAELEDFVLPQDAVISFLSLVETLAREQGLGVETQSISVEELDQKGEFESLVLTVKVEGAYDRVTRMLAILETMPHQVVVHSVSMGRESNGNWSGVFNITVTKFASSE